MIRKFFIVPVVLLCMIKNLCAQTDSNAEKLTLQQCIQIALKNNDQVQHKEITSDIARADWQGAKGYMLPTLNGDVSHGVNTGRSIDPFTNAYGNQATKFANYSLNSSLTLFNAFAIQNNIKYNKLAYEASGYEVQNTKDATALQVILQYLQALTNEDLVALSKQQSDVSARQVERLDILNQEGAISPSQYYDLKGDYASKQLNVVNADNDLQTANVLLAQLLNLPYNRNRKLERLSLSDIAENIQSNTDSIYQAALKNLAIIKAVELRNRSAIYGVKAYRSQRYPSLYFNGGLFTNYSSNATTQNFVNSTDVESTGYVMSGTDKLPVFIRQDNYSISKINYGDQFSNNFSSTFSIGVSIPLLNNLRNKTLIKTAVLQQKDAEITLNTTKVQLQQNIEQAYVYMISSRNRFDVLTDQVNAFQESFREAEIKFNAGAITSVDYLVVKNNLDQANLNLIIAKYDYVLRSMVLDYYSGKLTF